jgi:hypothetical protein
MDYDKIGPFRDLTPIIARVRNAFMAKMNWDRVRIEKLSMTRGSERIDCGEPPTSTRDKHSFTKRSNLGIGVTICPKCSARLKEGRLASHLRKRCPKTSRALQGSVPILQPPVCETAKSISAVPKIGSTAPKLYSDGSQAVLLLRALESSTTPADLRGWTRSELIAVRDSCTLIAQRFAQILNRQRS